MSARPLGLLCVLVLGLTGCVTPAAKIEPQPAKVIGLDEAVAEIQLTLARAKNRPNSEKAGLFPSKATVTFVMADLESVAGTTGGSIGVALPIGLTMGVSNEVVNTHEGTVSNTIVLEFENALLAPMESVVGQIADRAKWKTIEEANDGLKDGNARTPPEPTNAQ